MIASDLRPLDSPKLCDETKNKNYSGTGTIPTSFDISANIANKILIVLFKRLYIICRRRVDHSLIIFPSSSYIIILSCV